MNDHYNREINYLRVSITDRCNLRCTYCMPKEGVSAIGHDDILRYEEIIRVVRAALSVGIVKVRLTGGEPLVRRGVLNFIESLKSVEGLQDLSMTTNGVLLESSAEDIFRAGLRRINVSLDSLDADKYRKVTRGGSLECVLRGIEEAHRVGFSPIKINIVSIKGFNENEILDFARMTLSKPYQMRFIELMPFGKTGRDYENRYLSCESVLREIERTYPLESLETKSTRLDGPARRYRIKDAPGEIGFISAVSQHFCRSCNRLRLTADGQLRACLFSEAEIDLKTPMRKGCGDEELVALIHRAIETKPRTLSDTGTGLHLKKCMRKMSAIGG